MFRSGLPDKLRREAILMLYNLNSNTCETKYQTIIKMQSEEFLTHTKKACLASKSLEYHCLNDEGIHHLEIIMTLLFKERNINHSPMMI